MTGAAQMLTIRVPLAVWRRGGRKLVVTPGGKMNRGASGADSTLVKALDRLTHRVSFLSMNGDSYRLKQSTGRRRVLAKPEQSHGTGAARPVAAKPSSQKRQAHQS